MQKYVTTVCFLEDHDTALVLSIKMKPEVDQICSFSLLVENFKILQNLLQTLLPSFAKPEVNHFVTKILLPSFAKSLISFLKFEFVHTLLTLIFLFYGVSNILTNFSFSDGMVDSLKDIFFAFRSSTSVNSPLNITNSPSTCSNDYNHQSKKFLFI